MVETDMSTSTPKKSWLLAELPQLLLFLALIMAFRSSLADHYFVPSGSMEYTLLPGDRVFVDKSAYGLRLPFTDVEVVQRNDVERGEIVIFDSPHDGTRLIKRIVGIGGDTIELHNGLLSVNGMRLSALSDGEIEQFGERRAYLNLQDGGGPDIKTSVIPKGFLLAVGDHRGNSKDGRFFGFVAEDEVYGRAVAVYYRRGEGFLWGDL